MNGFKSYRMELKYFEVVAFFRWIISLNRTTWNRNKYVYYLGEKFWRA